MINLLKPKIPDIPINEITFLEKHDPKWSKYIKYYENKCHKATPISFDLNALVVADTHNTLTDDVPDVITKIIGNVDCVFLLGDISDRDMQYLLQAIPQEKTYCVAGNHDAPFTYERYGLNHIDQTPVALNNGIRIAGIDGSVKYKGGDYISYSQKDSITALEGMEPVDILLSHDTPYMSNSAEPCHHKGLVGISQYLYRSQTPLNIHGHIHQNKIDKLANGGISVNITGVQILSIKSEGSTPDFTIKGVI